MGSASVGWSVRIQSGDVRAVARAITLVEENSDDAVRILAEIFPKTGRANVIGVTGAPGSGKSSLVDRLIAGFRAAGHRVGVVAVDPSSAFSGGAILGDRVRMQRHSSDPDVFIRSMATRGHLGGLSRATNDAIDLLDAAGYDPILLETVGVGQDEVDVIKTADAVLVVLVPGMGDDIQAIKAGILEIADHFVINKADHPGADRLESELQYMLSLVPGDGRPKPPIHRTVATRDEGVEALRMGVTKWLEGLDRQRRFLRRRERAEARFRSVLTDRLVSTVLAKALSGGSLASIVDSIADRRVDPYSAADAIVSRVEVS